MSIAIRALLAADALLILICLLNLVFPLFAPLTVGFAFHGGESPLLFYSASIMVLPICGIAIWLAGRNIGWRDRRAIGWASLPVAWTAGMAAFWLTA